MEKESTTVPTFKYYSTYHGHEVRYLQTLLTQFRSRYPEKNFIYFAGDSSLDNKYWFDDEAEAVNGYQHVLKPPRMRKDVCYHLNSLCAQAKQGGESYIVINTSVEATTLAQRGTVSFPIRFPLRLIRRPCEEPAGAGRVHPRQHQRARRPHRLHWRQRHRPAALLRHRVQHDAAAV
jgi:hypothetical protein